MQWCRDYAAATKQLSYNKIVQLNPEIPVTWLGRGAKIKEKKNKERRGVDCLFGVTKLVLSTDVTYIQWILNTAAYTIEHEYQTVDRKITIGQIVEFIETRI